MRQSVFHGILVDVAFTDRQYPQTFPIFANKRAGDWALFGITVAQDEIEVVVADIQSHMRGDEHFYAHLYDDETCIIIYKKRMFRVTSHASSWKVAQDYGVSLGIPPEQLDFWPNRFQDEIHYFEPQDFVKL